MEVLQQQMVMVSDEVTTLKNELIALKGAHAALHQSAAESGQKNVRDLGDQSSRIDRIERKVDEIKETAERGGSYKKPRSLMEAKEVQVEKFLGSMTDSRAKFLAWGERIRDKVELFDSALGEAMLRAEKHTDVITAEVSLSWGISLASSKELHGFLKDRTDGVANSVCRCNKTGVGLETWRMLAKQYNPMTLTNTMNASHMETHPRGATKLSDLPACLSEWELNLRRCVQEGRDPPNDATKRLALLRMLPAKEKQSIWNVANQLYPTFQDLLSKVHELIRDEVDNKNGVSPMDIDQLEVEGAADTWETTNQTLIGKGPDGEDMVYSLQRKGMRCASSKRVEEKGLAAETKIRRRVNGTLMAAPGADEVRTGQKSAMPNLMCTGSPVKSGQRSLARRKARARAKVKSAS